MTAREKLRLEHPEITDSQCYSQDGMYCPNDFGYIRIPHADGGCFRTSCKECWDREIPETNLVVGDSKVEHPDTDIPVISIRCRGCKHEFPVVNNVCVHCDDHNLYEAKEKKTIYAHIGPFVEESSTITQSAQPDKPDLELKVERKTMLGTDDMHITSETIPASKIINLSPDEKTRLFEIIDKVMSSPVDETNKPRIICISGKAQHGKDTTAGYLKEYLEEKGKRVLITHYGDLVKYICTTFFGWDGKKDERGRSLLQEVGTDAIRTKTPDFWVRFIKDVIDHFPDKWDYVIIPDCRFPNEVDYLKEHGYSVKHVRVIRSNFISPLTIEQQKHISEVALDDVIPDVILFNTFGLEELRHAVRNRGLDK